MWTFPQMLDLFSTRNRYRFLQCAEHGLEKESLRISKDGLLAKTPHPESLGAALTNDLIKTDFSEAQVELATPVFHMFANLMENLDHIQAFIYQNIGSELLWPFSMPPDLKDGKNIPIGYYGSSQEGQKKTIYRRGLAKRYGPKMQTICGIHYNFSFCHNFWNFLYKQYSDDIKSKFISKTYFHLIRNFLRFSWLPIYLFGAAPVVHESYLSKPVKELARIGSDSYGGQYATSLRMSMIGYNNARQPQVKIRYTTLEEYAAGLQEATITPYAPYTKLGIFKNGQQIQLNDSLLQIENENYALIRPKRRPKYGESVSQSLVRRGVKYLEVRTVDLNPLVPAGIDLEQLRFTHLFLLYCLFQPSCSLDHPHLRRISANQNEVAYFGRKPGLKLIDPCGCNSDKPLLAWAHELLTDMSRLVPLLDKNYSKKPYQKALDQQVAKVINPNLTPSAQILQAMTNKKSFLNFGLNIAQKNKEYYAKVKLPPKIKQKLEKLAADSLKKAARME